MDLLEKLGIKKPSNQEKNFRTSLFYFMREFKFSPLDEIYTDGKSKRWIKKGMIIPLFNAMMEEMQEHYKREEQEMKKGRR